MKLLQLKVKLRDFKGFTLLEVLASVTILGLVSVSALTATQSYKNYITKMRIRTEASVVATQKIDQLRSVNPETLPSIGTIGPETISSGERNFQVYLRYCTNDEWCRSTRTRHVEIEVRFNGEKVFEAETVFTRLR